MVNPILRQCKEIEIIILRAIWEIKNIILYVWYYIYIIYTTILILNYLSSYDIRILVGAFLEHLKCYISMHVMTCNIKTKSSSKM